VTLPQENLISNQDYHRDPAVSASHLHAVSKSPWTYYKRFIDPDRPTSKPTQAMKIGTFTHVAVLEPNELQGRYAVIESRTTKAGKDKIAALEQRGIEPVTQTEYDTVMHMADAVRANADAAWLLSEGEAERSLWWDDTSYSTPLTCKCRPDWWNDDIVVDLKTTKDASPKGFAKSCATFRYHVQQMHYMRGTRCKKFIFIAVEKEYPYNVGVYELDQEAAILGEQLRDGNMRTIAICKKNNAWPTFSKKPLALPRWAFYDEHTPDDFPGLTF
jgi:exodeoxyribonuclease VIII